MGKLNLCLQLNFRLQLSTVQLLIEDRSDYSFLQFLCSIGMALALQNLKLSVSKFVCNYHANCKSQALAFKFMKMCQ